ncbi:MAG TPA: hypothetical protein VF021_04935 [Longimicrobiales bacterium]
MLSDNVLSMLRAARAAEKQQALFYRALSAIAEERALGPDIEALNGLLADEQHHLSRISVRLVELGYEIGDAGTDVPECDFAEWRTTARERERAEIERYETLLKQALDRETAQILRGILAVEREHERNLGGKYTEA